MSNCYIKNISLSGAFIMAPNHLLNFKEVEIDFKIGIKHFELIGDIVSKHETNGIVGFGVQFRFGGIGGMLNNREMMKEVSRAEKEELTSIPQYKSEQTL